jgi:hypothetical protein
MIYVYINGQLKHKQQVIEASELMLNDFCETCAIEVDINVEIKRRLDDDMAGYCWGDFEHIEIEIARQSADHTYTRSELLLNLTHELVHAKQLINKQFEYNIRNHLRYEQLPWEKEAYGLEESLYQKYFSKL